PDLVVHEVVEPFRAGARDRRLRGCQRTANAATAPIATPYACHTGSHASRVPPPVSRPGGCHGQRESSRCRTVRVGVPTVCSCYPGNHPVTATRAPGWWRSREEGGTVSHREPRPHLLPYRLQGARSVHAHVRLPRLHGGARAARHVRRAALLRPVRGALRAAHRPDGLGAGAA